MQDSQAEYEEVSAEHSPVFNHRVKLLVALVLLIGALSYLAFLAFESATVYYVTVSELNQQVSTSDSKLVRVNGKLDPDSYYREPDNTLAHFTLTDGEDTLKAVYNGVLPDLFFNEHSEIILEGNPNADGVFNTQTVIVKCPSKYIALNPEQSDS